MARTCEHLNSFQRFRWQQVIYLKTHRKDLFGGDKTKKVPTWVGGLPDGKQLPLDKFLQEMGENGWEIAGVAQTSIPVSGQFAWLDLPHWLYFKRPKIDNLPQK